MICQICKTRQTTQFFCCMPICDICKLRLEDRRDEQIREKAEAL